jgi:hypothetical protein
MSQEIIKAILKELNTYGVRYLNGNDLTAKNGIVYSNMAVDLTEDRLQVNIDEGSFTLIFGDDMRTYKRLMNNSILKPFIIFNEVVKLTFCVRKKSGMGSLEIGKNKKTFFNGVTNYTFDDADYSLTSSSVNGHCEWFSSDDMEIVQRNKDIILFLSNEFKDKTYYKEWEYTDEKIRRGLSMLKNL